MDNVQPWAFSDGLRQACCCRPAVLPAFSGLRKGSATSVCSPYFLNHSFCCSMMPVDSKRTVVTWVKLTTNSYTCRSKSSCLLTGGASPFCVLRAVVAQGLNILGGDGNVDRVGESTPHLTKNLTSDPCIPKSYMRCDSSLLSLCMYLYQLKI